MPCVIKAHGARYELENPGGVIGKSLAAGEPYERRVLEHIYRQGLTGLAVDVGAQVGNHSLWLALVCGLRVVAFEPVDYGRLTENVRRNGAAVEIHPIALGAAAGNATAIGRGRLETGSGDVQVRTLDSFDLRDVALLKIDVEGMEAEVIAGGLQTISRYGPVIYAEAWDEAAHDRVLGQLGPLGYEHTKTFGATPLEEWRR